MLTAHRRLSGTDPAVVRLVAEVEAHNFAQTHPADVDDFRQKVRAFIYDCSRGHCDFTGSTFREYLGPSLQGQYEANQQCYASGAKNQRRFALVKDFLPSEGTVLDYGTGDATFASFVASNTELRVEGCDVMDWRAPHTRNDIRFHFMDRNDYLQDCGDAHFDSVVAMYVLHHVHTEDLQNVLQEIKRVCGKNVIVVEETFGVTQQEVRQLCSLSQAFSQLPQEAQVQFTKIRDWFRNVVVKQISGMSMPLEFKTIPDWVRIFEGVGLRVIETKIAGFNSQNAWSSTAFNVVFHLHKS